MYLCFRDGFLCQFYMTFPYFLMSISCTFQVDKGLVDAYTKFNQNETMHQQC
jgi:hypothetical protein